MRNVVAFVRLARPKFLLGGFAGFALGAVVAAHQGIPLAPRPYIAGQVMVTAFHLMTHFANDYFDREADRLTLPTAFAGGSGVLVSGALAPPVALVAALVCAAVGVIAAAGFAQAGNPIVTLLGLAIGALAWCYSAPPLRLAARGWGELDTATIVAVLVPLAGFAVFAGTIDRPVLAATAAPALAMLAMMLAVEWPDRRADAAAGKANLLVRLGRSSAGRLAAVCALLVVPALAVTPLIGAPVSVAGFALLLGPLLWGFARRITTPGAAAVDIAAHGVSVFLLTVVFEILGYAAMLR